MRKNKFLFLLIIFMIVSCYFSLPNYKVYSSTNFSNGNTIETTLNVISYRYWRIDELAEQIKEEYYLINGKPTMLEIRIYYSKWQLQKTKPIKTKIY